MAICNYCVASMSDVKNDQGNVLYIQISYNEINNTYNYCRNVEYLEFTAFMTMKRKFMVVPTIPPVSAITSHLSSLNTSKGTTKWDVKNKGPGLGQGQHVVVLNQLISPTPLGNLIFNENADITKISDQLLKRKQTVTIVGLQH